MPTPATATSVFISAATPNISTAPSPLRNPPVVTLIAAGAQASRSESIIITLTNSFGESANSQTTTVAVPANFVIQVGSPGNLDADAPGSIASGWNCYAAVGGGTLKKQNTTAIAMGTIFTEAGSGLTTGGAAVPNLAAGVPALIDGNNNLANTPSATGGISVPQSPSGAVTTNTGRSNEATGTYLATSLNILNVGTTPPPAKN